MAKNQDVTIESSLPIVQQNGLLTNKDAYVGGTLEVVGIATFDATPVFASANFSGNVDVAGTLGVGGALTATGAISSVTTVTAKNATAPVAAGAVPTQAFGFSNIANYGVYYGTGAPGGATGQAAATGSIYINYAGSATADRAYICKGGTAWTAILTSA